jgi:HCOMODA/2-hydroxy-3-carboxy-muconic semialdehyde decarboxylase
VSYLLGEESQKTLAVIDQIHGRAWDLWKRAALEKMAPK